ncbi:CRAL-TRIO domain-containing protein [Alternaria rosae]|uniref:CRAL-TRIO domain-containing protein n=1 Tax=Alternaria rosae TaxID=1187941 RepID=UPI001E8E9613|nr:CRAL-TRIO domain-containing protein [Alternaria rosae]KAH6875863.1 CRAL-TRIO domain-containing protein [Alternaria rosae]
MSAIGPFEEPAPGCKPAAAPALTADQQTKYDELLADVRGWETLPTTSAKTAETSPISDDERMWLTRECLLRYLRATKWNLPQAIQRLRSTLIWRREYGTDRFTAEYISEENETGKQVLLGFDNEGRPCLYLLPQNQNTKETPKRVEHLVYMLERTIDLHPPGQESLALLIDFRNTGAGGTPSMGIAKQVLDILQNHYPERLGRALLTHLPWYVNAFLKLINPFIDPVTKSKIKPNEPLPNHVPTSQLMKVSGGEVDFKYDHSVYWPALEKISTERRQQRKERWEKAGKIIGESEIYLWGGDEPSLGSGTAEKTAGEAAVPAAAESSNTMSNGGTELVEGVEKLDIKEGEPVKAAA